MPADSVPSIVTFAELTLRSLGLFARSLAWSIRGGSVRKLAKEDVQRLLLDAVESGRLRLDLVSKDMKKDLEGGLLGRSILRVAQTVAGAHGLVWASGLKKNKEGKRQVELTQSDGTRAVMVTLADPAKRQIVVQQTPPSHTPRPSGSSRRSRRS